VTRFLFVGYGFGRIKSLKYSEWKMGFSFLPEDNKKLRRVIKIEIGSSIIGITLIKILFAEILWLHPWWIFKGNAKEKLILVFGEQFCRKWNFYALIIFWNLFLFFSKKILNFYSEHLNFLIPFELLKFYSKFSNKYFSGYFFLLFISQILFHLFFIIKNIIF
jgi:hypothetical protein